MQISGANTYQQPASPQISSQRGSQADTSRAKNITKNPVTATLKKAEVANEGNKDYKGYSAAKKGEITSPTGGNKGQIIDYRA